MVARSHGRLLQIFLQASSPNGPHEKRNVRRSGGEGLVRPGDRLSPGPARFSSVLSLSLQSPPMLHARRCRGQRCRHRRVVVSPSKSLDLQVNSPTPCIARPPQLRGAAAAHRVPACGRLDTLRLRLSGKFLPQFVLVFLELFVVVLCQHVNGLSQGRQAQHGQVPRQFYHRPLPLQRGCAPERLRPYERTRHVQGVRREGIPRNQDPALKQLTSMCRFVITYFL